MFSTLQTKDGSFILRSGIARVQDNPKNKNECTVVLTNGQSFIVESSALEIAEEAEEHDEIIPAQVGWYILIPFNGKRQNAKPYTKLPIIGWRKEKWFDDYKRNSITFRSKPVVAGLCDSLDVDYSPIGFLMPDGRLNIFRPYKLFESEEAFAKWNEAHPDQIDSI
jgi:hypothetical protein